MGIGKDGAVRRQLRTLFNVGAVRELTDGQLLERFASDRGEAAELAFAVLVERHGPMVMRVCRGVLADPNDAQDAFQATFLVLVRRARGLWVRDSIGPWLHQVAYRTATCARATAARHRRLEQRAARPEHESRPERDFELERLLHEEIDRLPERFRSPVVLCDLEGRTYEQVARHLGWPVGTVKSRLSRGRERLRDRLIRRGVASELGPLAVVGAFRVPVIPLSPSLLDATTAAAVNLTAIGSAVRGPAVTLAEGVLRTMSMPQWWKVATVLIVAGATASGVEILGAGGGAGAQGPAPVQAKAALVGAAPTQAVKRGHLELSRTSRGSVEATRVRSLVCNVEGRTTIIRLVPEGQRVKKGEVVAELDSAALRDRLVNQRLATRNAEVQYVNARLKREVAEIAVKEYSEGLFKQDLEALTQAIDGHRDAIRKLEERLDRTRKAREQLKAMQERTGGVKSPADVVAGVDIQDRIDEAELSRDRERRALAEAEGRRDVLVKFTRDRTIKEREAEVKQAHSDQLAKQSAWALEKAREEKLEKQIASCTLIAPIDGTVVYANDPIAVRRGGIQIEEGATVRERQVIVSVVDTDAPMQINLKVPEAWIDQVQPTMKARVKVDAFADQTLEGVVTEVAPLPDPMNSFAEDVKVYTTRIRLERDQGGLRPGMTAEAEIVLGQRDDAISVPVGSVTLDEGKTRVALRRDGGVEWREVVLGASDGRKVEIKEGLRDGDQVILDPAPFLSDEQRARMKIPTEPARRKEAAQRKGKTGKTPIR